MHPGCSFVGSHDYVFCCAIARNGVLPLSRKGTSVCIMYNVLGYKLTTNVVCKTFPTYISTYITLYVYH